MKKGDATNFLCILDSVGRDWETMIALLYAADVRPGANVSMRVFHRTIDSKTTDV